MKEKRIYRCDGSIEGILTAIYDAYESRYGHANIIITEAEETLEIELFTEYIDVSSDKDKADKVANAIKEKISPLAYEMIIKSALSNCVGKSDAIYRFLQVGFSGGKSVLNQLNHPYVYPIFEMNRKVTNEGLHYMGFVRFQELENGILFSEISPKNHILPLIAPHFEDRFTRENWMIYDRKRKIAGVHRSFYPYFLVDGSEVNESALKQFSDSEHAMQFFWNTFVDTIGIKERKNDALQLQMLPKRFREFMPEFSSQKYK